MNRYTHSQLLEMFERHLSQLSLPDDPSMLYNPIRYALDEGGKRMRPVLTLLAYNLYADDVERALPAAMAVEIFHNFTLLHDDIMDNAAVRRGRPSVYAKWGNNVAILSGDVMLIEAYKQLQGIADNHLPQVLERFNTMASQVCEGQQYDMDFESRQKVAVVEYMNMIELKTAALLSGSMTIGAILAGASESDVNKIYRAATEVGLAFQLQDDLLDSYGDERLGKKIGGDILEGKKTYLMIISLSHATEQQREVLRTTHLRKDLTDEQKISMVKAIYDELGAPAMTEQQINLRISRAVSILDTLDIPAERTACLREYFESLVGRRK
ncbi:MAG: polyprenyl synthetase family protein [Alistipes sp.]|nr:polyprenyl synthetase family protein [Alistipes sp.]MBR0394355.1 polyprenyl synthetase family protein [Alistipes sp.]